MIYKETSLAWLDVDLPTPKLGTWKRSLPPLIWTVIILLGPKHDPKDVSKAQGMLSKGALKSFSSISGTLSLLFKWSWVRRQRERETLESQWMWLWGAKGGTEHTGGNLVESDRELQIPFVKHFLQILKLFSFRAIGAYVKHFAMVNYKHKCSHQIQLTFRGERKREEGKERETISP